MTLAGSTSDRAKATRADGEHLSMAAESGTGGGKRDGSAIGKAESGTGPLLAIWASRKVA